MNKKQTGRAEITLLFSIWWGYTTSFQERCNRLVTL